MIAVILAGGTGSRAGGGLPKQFHLLCGRPMLWWSMRAFRQADPDARLVVVVHPSHFATLDALFSELPEEERFDFFEVCGGSSRVESVHNALREIADGLIPDLSVDEVVAVHDAARPLVDAALIRRGLDSFAKFGGSIPVVPLSDSIRRISPEGSLPEDRSGFVAVQTPQFFDFGLLKKCYDTVGNPQFTDDASIVQASSGSVSLFEGDPKNIKVTNPMDFVVAETLLRSVADGIV